MNTVWNSCVVLQEKHDIMYYLSYYTNNLIARFLKSDISRIFENI